MTTVNKIILGFSAAAIVMVAGYLVYRSKKIDNTGVAVEQAKHFMYSSPNSSVITLSNTSTLLGAPTITPSKVDLGVYFAPYINDQKTGSCTAEAATSVMEFLYQRYSTDNSHKDLSRLFTYYNGRVEQGIIQNISNYAALPEGTNGCGIDNVLDGILKNGACSESDWPYDMNNVSIKPDSSAYIAAKKYTIDTYNIVNDLDSVKKCLAIERPVLLEIFLYPSFYDGYNNRGLITLPSSTELDSNIHTGHAVIICGFDDSTRLVRCVNSWGNTGDNGFFYLPYEYINKENHTIGNMYVILNVQINGTVIITKATDTLTGYHWDSVIHAYVSNDHYCGVEAEWNNVTKKCELKSGYTCPYGTHWDGEACVTCDNGTHWNEQLKQCVKDATQCPTGQHWNEEIQQCFPDVVNGVNVLTKCPIGQYYDITENKCKSLDLNGDSKINILDLTVAKNRVQQ